MNNPEHHQQVVANEDGRAEKGDPSNRLVGLFVKADTTLEHSCYYSAAITVLYMQVFLVLAGL